MDLSQQWKRIVNTLRDGIIIVDTFGVIQATNPSAEKMTGYTARELLGSSCRILNCTGCKIIGKGPGPEYCKLFRVGKSKVKKCMITHKSNRSVDILKSASVLEDEKGNAVGAVEVLTDMTDVTRKQQEIDTLKQICSLNKGFYGIIGKTPVMENLFHLIRNVAPTDAPVLIQGGSGSGKELVAMAIHKNSARREGPFIKVNCAALNQGLLESELFGHVKGAFTGAQRERKGRFEAADTGTIFLDEIGDIPMATQVKLLRVLEEKEIERVGDHQPVSVDVRIVSATNRDLAQLMESGEFREDLFFRINVFPLHCPDLSDRKEDIPMIVDNLMDQRRNAAGKEITGVTGPAMQALCQYSWPGNVRELRNAIDYAFVLCPGGRIDCAHLPAHIPGQKKTPGLQAGQVPESGEQKEALLALLRQTRGNRTQAAGMLGISRVTLWKRIKKAGIRIPEDI